MPHKLLAKERIHYFDKFSTVQLRLRSPEVCNKFCINPGASSLHCSKGFHLESFSSKLSHIALALSYHAFNTAVGTFKSMVSSAHILCLLN